MQWDSPVDGLQYASESDGGRLSEGRSAFFGCVLIHLSLRYPLERST